MDLNFNINSEVSWQATASGVILFLGDSTETLRYPQAAIWDFLSRSSSYSRILALLPSIADVSTNAAEMLIEEAISEWMEKGYLNRVNGNG